MRRSRLQFGLTTNDKNILILGKNNMKDYFPLHLNQLREEEEEGGGYEEEAMEEYDEGE